MESKYKPGDKVTIIEREGSSADYPLFFGKGMCVYSGKIVTIEKVEPITYRCNGCKFYNGDDFRYYIKEDGGAYYWHSSMFKKAESTTQKVNNLQNTKNHENRFQKPEASVRRGNVPKGRTVCGRTNKARVTIKHLSNKPVYC